MTVIRRASLDDPDATRPLSRGSGSLARVGPLVIGRATLDPGWRWSADIKPSVGTEWCEIHHLHVLVAGRFAAQMVAEETVETFEPGDVFDLPPGHDAWVVGDSPAVLLDVAGNVSDFGAPTANTRRVVTMLMTDILDSTPTATRLGDAGWRQRLADHDRVVRTQLRRFRGEEIDTTGDGFFVAFDSAAAAIDAARAIRDAVRDLGLELRIGIHAGEIQLAVDGVRGIAVHTVARVMAAARPSQILVSSLVRALTEGSPQRFIDQGPYQLKGIDAPMTLFEVD